MYITPDTKDQIFAQADLVDVAEDYGRFKRSGKNYLQDCPKCGASKKMNIFPAKEGKFGYKCFGCDEGGVGAVDYLIHVIGMAYPEALEKLADRYNIVIEPSSNGQTKKRKSDVSFRDQQLRDSGIPLQNQKWYLQKDSETQEERDRYQSASWKYGRVVHGDDMILHYLDLDGKPLQFKNKKGKMENYVRIRWSNPELHKDSHGKPMKYQAPPKSGNKLWMPQPLIEWHSKPATFPGDTLYVIEGEKKADKMCLHDMPAVGVGGIHNFAYGNEMPTQFQSIIRKFDIKNVVFVVDSDYDDLSLNSDFGIDNRARTFSKAVINFKKYFYAYNNQGIHLDIFFAYGKDRDYKGMDDLLVLGLKQKEEQLREEFEKAMKDRGYDKKYIELHDITSQGDYQIRGIWKLTSAHEFYEHHKDEIQKKLKGQVFKLRGLQRRISDDGELELAQKIMPNEIFWSDDSYQNKQNRFIEKVNFDYLNMMNFLQHRGYGRYVDDNKESELIQVEGNVIRRKTAEEIQEYALQIADEVLAKEDNRKRVMNMLLRGATRYFSDRQLRTLKSKSINEIDAEADTEYFFFKNGYWKITADGIESKPMHELPGQVWEDRMINAEPELIEEDLLQTRRDEEDKSWIIEMDEIKKQYLKKCDLFRFIMHTSNFHWRKEYKVVDVADGRKKYVYRNDFEGYDEDELEDWYAHAASKMIAIGYVIHSYRQKSTAKAIISMDGVESPVGRSNGGTGKSIFSEMFEYLVPTVGPDSKKNMHDDDFLYDEATRQTKVVVFDDCPVNLDLEHFFKGITKSLTVNKKGKSKFTIDPPRFIFNTNHAPKGQGNSFERRQFVIAFSDFYNEWRTPRDMFGHDLYDQWDDERWNIAYNLWAQCVQLYLKYGLQYKAPDRGVKIRKLRQFMGESFLEWAELKFSDSKSGWLNKRFEKKMAMEDFFSDHPGERKYTKSRYFKEKCEAFAEYMGLEFNIHVRHTKSGRDIFNGQEHLLISDDELDVDMTIPKIDRHDLSGYTPI